MPFRAGVSGGTNSEIITDQLARIVPSATGVKLSPWREIPTTVFTPCFYVFSDLQTAHGLQPTKTDEVARNGVLQRITSARGFL